MANHLILLTVILIALPSSAPAAPPARWWNDEVEAALGRAGKNRPELEKALTRSPEEWRRGMAFLIANMPRSDLISLKAQYLLANAELAYKARAAVPWGKNIPEEIFLNHVLPYANVDEKRDDWRKEFYDLCLPLVKDCKTPSEAACKLNVEVFKKLKVGYSTQRKAANQCPAESIAQGKASCTGLSILLSDACRSVCVPARLVGTPMWTNKRGNHTWVEIWDKDWHFTGACEADPHGLDRGWFVGDAAKAKKDSPEHAIYATTFRKTALHFPLVWARQNKEVPAENVTDRYAKKEAAKADGALLAVRVVDATRKRVVRPVTVTAMGEPAVRRTGESRGETADANDLLTFDLPSNRDYVIAAGGVTKTVRSGAAGRLQTIEIALPGVAVEAGKSSEALKALREALAAHPSSLLALASKDFASVPLTKADAALARKLIWESHVAIVRKERSDEVANRLLKDGKLEMPFFFKVFGESPKEGHSLWISLHGGGGAPKRVNDRQWENQKKLYTLPEGIYLAPRAPTDTWNLWHQDHIDRLFARLIEDMIALERVNPDRVYLLGYSAGGDGVYQLAPRLADRWAAAAMMAGHPNGVSLLSLRNVPFALQVGAKDSAYNRNKVAQEYGDQLAELRRDDPKGYEHFVKIYPGKGHWMDGEDKAALPWMAGFTRNPVPSRVVWKQTGVPHPCSYWLAVPPGEAKSDALVIASRREQTISIAASDKVSKLLVHLDDRMMDLDREVRVTRAGKELFAGMPLRTVAVMLRTLAGRGDPRLMFDAEIALELTAKKTPPTALPDPIQEELRQVFHSADSPPDVPPGVFSELELLPDRPAQGKLQELRKAVETWRAEGKGAPPRAHVLIDLPAPYEPYVFLRGNPNNRGESVRRQFLGFLAGPDARPFQHGSGRLELAHAIVDRHNPLTARVLVNRVWLHHFGKGLVGTPSDFGLRSEPPTHPELLDHLATTFMDNGWSIKKLHRLIVLSAAYQQSSADRPDARRVDPENSLLWRMNRRRLDFEATRDALLFVSSRLDRTISGPPVKDLLGGASRRTVYGFVDRLQLAGLYRAFDFPSPDASSPQRDTTTIPQQALFLMNNPFVIACAQRLVQSPEIAAEKDCGRRVEYLYRRLYGRAPAAEEVSLAEAFTGRGVETSRWVRYAQGLLMANEFVFVD